MARDYSVYILSNETRMLYIGVTNDLERRLSEHKLKLADGYTRRRNITRLVWYENYPDVNDAIAREKQLKGWRRSRKIVLIETMNPRWRDLSDEWEQPEVLRAPLSTSSTTLPSG